MRLPSRCIHLIVVIFVGTSALKNSKVYAQNFQETLTQSRAGKALHALHRYQGKVTEKIGDLKQAHSSSCQEYWSMDTSLLSSLAQYERQLQYVFEKFPNIFEENPETEAAFRQDQALLVDLRQNLVYLSENHKQPQFFSTQHFFKKYFQCNDRISIQYLNEWADHPSAEKLLKILTKYQELAKLFGVPIVLKYLTSLAQKKTQPHKKPRYGIEVHRLYEALDEAPK